ncbi:hypothetical protein [Nostoc sp.]
MIQTKLHINIKSQSRVINSNCRKFASKYSRRNKGNKVHSLIIDCVPVKDKDEGVKTIKTLIKRKRQWTTKATAQELSWRIQLGHTFIWSYLEGGLTANNFVSSSLLVLDFDNKIAKESTVDSRHISIAQVLTRACEYSLEFCFAYTTLSHSDTTHKFRLVFQLQKTVTDVNQFKLLIGQLFVVFPEVDTGCQSAEKKVLW